MTKLLALVSFLHIHPHGHISVGPPSGEDIHFKWLMTHLGNGVLAEVLGREFSSFSLDLCLF